MTLRYRIPMRHRRTLSMFVGCFLVSAFAGPGLSQEPVGDRRQYPFEIDPLGDGKRVQACQILTKTDSSHCSIEFTFIISGRTISFHDRGSLFPVPLKDLDLFRAEIKKIGNADTLDYIVGVGASGIQSRKRLIFDPGTRRVLEIHYADGGASGMEEVRKLEKNEYLMILSEAAYILPGFEGYGPPLFSGYIVRFSRQGISLSHILHPTTKTNAEVEKGIERVHRNTEWCRLFCRTQLKAYQEALTTAQNPEKRREIQTLIDRTRALCGNK